jgi:hypothetical protein
MFDSGANRIRAALVALGLLLLPAAVQGAERAPPEPRVVVLDAGTFITVEARQAKLGEVLERLSQHLNVELFNTDRLDLQRIVSGRRSGPVDDIMRWLVPNGGFILISEDPSAKNLRPKLARIGFLGPGGATPADIASAAMGKPVDPAAVETKRATAAPDFAAGSGAGKQTRPSATEIAIGKPDTLSTSKSEIKSVVEQLETATPHAQLSVEAAARDPSGNSPLPAFLAPQGNVAQLTLEQQMERSQALAVEQLRALMDAFNAACKGDASSVGNHAKVC